jgi:hypothetical protein
MVPLVNFRMYLEFITWGGNIPSTWKRALGKPTNGSWTALFQNEKNHGFNALKIVSWGILAISASAEGEEDINNRNDKTPGSQTFC